MPFIREILNYRSLSIVGLEKNTGKTECLNYILERLPLEKMRVGVSSIGIDGERKDQVTQTAKPEIFLREGIIFSTTEKHFRQRKLVAELLEIGDVHTSLGRIVTAKVVAPGKVMLSGPPSTQELIKWIKNLNYQYNVQLSIIDGALSRLSPASPAVSEAMILATGAALSLTFSDLIAKTNHVVKLVNIESTKHDIPIELTSSQNGIWLYDTSRKKHAVLYDSAFTMNEREVDRKIDGDLVFVSGAITDRLMNKLSSDKYLTNCEIVVKDFTKIFLTPLLYNNFIKKGGKISVMNRSKLLAICVNPVSPTGYKLDSNAICNELYKLTGVPAYDIFKYI